MESLYNLIPEGWERSVLLGLQVLAILLAGFILQRFVARTITRIGERYHLPPQFVLVIRGLLRWLIMGSAVLMVLERFGVSGSVLWAALSGFVAVAAVAFFAIWSVLSNLFCAVLIFTLGPFRLGDRVEVIESADKPGVKGRVVAINMLYTTLEDMTEGVNIEEAPLLQIPNSLFFQKAVRRWRGTDVPFTFLDR
ncbi:mechanosensitive ion channel family protein [Pseudomonas duriflava]|uniref:mechanosensitive ion channel family protein n=1 Tax=Pseudomonas duriflava TaxID=459528 RepID=UPI001FCB2352|nr:mechanosensitive ion channel family protein [Pseudomonas duriflava]